MLSEGSLWWCHGAECGPSEEQLTATGHLQRAIPKRKKHERLVLRREGKASRKQQRRDVKAKETGLGSGWGLAISGWVF